jgi:hypothetical protein
MVRTISGSDTYSGRYKLAKRGTYRIKATIVGRDTNTAATTRWRTFKVE